ncbi:hypothetical protein GCM10022221_30280 [Actinocorallia aurea]
MFIEVLLVLVSVVVVGALLACSGYAALQAVARARLSEKVSHTSGEVLECEPTPADVALAEPYRTRVRFTTVHGAEVVAVAGQEAPVGPSDIVPVRYLRSDPRTVVAEHTTTDAGSYAVMAVFLLVMAAVGFLQWHGAVFEAIHGWTGWTPPGWLSPNVPMLTGKEG